VSKYDDKQKEWSLAYQRSLKSFTIKMKAEDLERYKDMAERKGVPFRQFVLMAMEAFGAEEE
jgi:predicted DNA binding CopG/RHH family protein